ncbi:hypothetical protein TanjilG_08116 [Lupinus angustifolius]|uniref:Uncharacterized protein n=1 Tax=Lupinus angustifolius TaxID=3871 RepID=A0A4P1RLY2_LUPAN|nr:hypothetical protein TanjilG_08116 [Lupinus angustifolius]
MGKVGMCFHPDQDRILTVLEYARSQAKVVSGGAMPKAKIVKLSVKKKMDAKPTKKTSLKSVKKTKSVKSLVEKSTVKKAKKLGLL